MSAGMMESDVRQHPVILPDGSRIESNGSVVIVGPNGSGKTRRSREITSDVPIEVVSALRNTRISPQLQPMALQQAKANFYSQRESARNQPYELANDFDYMLTALIGDALETSLEYLRKARAGTDQKLPPLASLEKIQALWGELFPGRELRFRDYMPQVVNTVAVGDEPVEYSAWQMSDGEKAALYLAGRTLNADHNAVMLVDEPETHFHSLLAVRFWDAIESARPDLRLIYVTHDMTFAASRGAVRYLLANPRDGLTSIELATGSGDLAALLLGTASLSFYASRVIFCEGASDGLDYRIYSALFNSRDTIVQPVGSAEMVLRSVSALASSSLVRNLSVSGIIDRDFSSDNYFNALPSGVRALGVHEVETLFSLPGVVQAVANHLGVIFDSTDYARKIAAAYSDADRHKVAIERWKVLVNAGLTGVVSSVSAKNESLDSIVESLPVVFDSSAWSFSPETLLVAEKAKVEGVFDEESFDMDALLKLMPGKQLRGLPSSTLGLGSKNFDHLVVSALTGENETLAELGDKIRSVVSAYVPSIT